jgi:PAS domain S-box-containing protein
LVERTRAGMWVTDPDGRTLFVNDAFSRLLGRPAAELAGRELADLLEEDPEHVAPSLRGNVDLGDHTLRGADGAPIWATIASTPLVGVDGRRWGTLHTVSDITARKRVEVAQRFRAEANELLGRLALAALRGRRFEALMTESIQSLAELLDIEYAAVAERLSERSLRGRSLVGWGVPETTAVAPRSVTALALDADEPVVVADFANGAFPWSAAGRRRRIRSAIWLGLGGGRGLLTVHSRRPRRFSADEVGLLRGVGDVLEARWV